MSRRLSCCVALLVLFPACRYVGDRGMDFLDQFRGSVGVGSVAGVRAKALGVVDTGLMLGVKPRAASLGWRYGTPLFFNGRDARIDADQAEIIKTTSLVGLDYPSGGYDSARTSIALLPALFSWTDATPTDYRWAVPDRGADFADRHWIWSGETTRRNRYAQVHAFDVEVEIGFFLYWETGFSPGEAIDFLLGFFLIDVAKDDGRLGG